jgi:hypothetical protein
MHTIGKNWWQNVILKSHSKSLQNYSDAHAPTFCIIQTQVSQKILLNVSEKPLDFEFHGG